MSGYEWQGSGFILNIRVQPRASQVGFAGFIDDRIRLCLTTPPIDGKANQQLTAFLAKSFRVPKIAVLLLSGEHDRNNV